MVKPIYIPQDLIPEIKTFIEGKKDILQLGKEEWGADLAFMVDITTHLLSLNRTLQGSNKLCHNLYSTSVFIKKLCLWKLQLASGATNHFPTLSNHKTKGGFDAYNRFISNLINEFEHRISGINSSLPLMKIFKNPMSIDVTTSPDNFQLELLDIQSDIGLREAFQSEGLLEFWSKVSEGKHPNLIANILKNSSVFGSTYVCEALFSKMVKIKNQYRNRLTNEHLKQTLHTSSCTIAPQFDKFVKTQRQCQVLH